MSPFLSVIANKNFRNLWLGQIFSQLAINMMAFVLLIKVYQQTASNTATSAIVLVIGLPAIFIGMVAGAMVDRLDKKNVLVFCNILRALTVLGFFFSRETLFFVYLLAGATSIITQFFVPAEAPTIPRFVKEDLLLTANSLFTFTFYTSMIFGFVLAGPFLKFFGPHNIFLFMSFLLVLAAFFVSRLPCEGKKMALNGLSLPISKIKNDLKEGFTFIKKNSQICFAIFLLTCSQALIATLASLCPGFADKILKIELEDASYLVMGPAALGLVLGALAVGNFGRKFKKEKLINSGIILAGVILLVLSLCVRARRYPYFLFKVESFLPPSFQFGFLEIAFFLFFLLGAANALIDVPANTILQEETERQFRGRVYGALTALIGGAAILPVVGGGALADLLGVGKVIFLIALLILSLGLYRMISRTRHSD